MLATMAFTRWVLLKEAGELTIRDVVSVLGLILIIYSIVIVVVLAETQNQLATAIGVLGTIAGYLFGTFQGKRTQHKDGSSTAAPDASA